MKCNKCESNSWPKQSNSIFFPSLKTSKKINDTLPTIPSTPLSKLFSFLCLTTLFTTLGPCPPPKKKSQLKPLPSPPYLNTNARGRSPRGKKSHQNRFVASGNKERLDSACKTDATCGLSFNFFRNGRKWLQMLPSSLASHEPVEPQGNPALPGTWQLPCNIRCGAGLYYNMGDVVEKRRPRQWMEGASGVLEGSSKAEPQWAKACDGSHKKTQ